MLEFNLAVIIYFVLVFLSFAVGIPMVKHSEKQVTKSYKLQYDRKIKKYEAMSKLLNEIPEEDIKKLPFGSAEKLEKALMYAESTPKTITAIKV